MNVLVSHFVFKQCQNILNNKLLQEKGPQLLHLVLKNENHSPFEGGAEGGGCFMKR